MALTRVTGLWLAVVALLAISALRVAIVAGNEGRFGESSALADSGVLSSSTRLEASLATIPGLEPASSEVETALAQTRRLLPPFLIESKAAAVIDAACGELLYGKNENTPLPPASLTKMMTAIAVLELVPDIDRVVTADVSGTHLARTTFSSVMGLEPGMQASVRDLLYGLMLPSGNDAALVLARVAGGDEQSFVNYMNMRAQQLGLAGTSFANPNGLDQKGLHSTATEMAYLGMAMMQNPLLASISATPLHVWSAGHPLRNGNRLLASYPGLLGVKIGYTERAGHTIVAAATRDGRQVYVSVLGSAVPYVDARQLLDWAFTTPRAC